VSFTVVPIHNLTLPAGTCIPFGNGFMLQDMPLWVHNDTELLKGLNLEECRAVLVAKHALVGEYEASEIGEPDPSWKGRTEKSVQELRTESVFLANIAFWLAQPSPVCFTVVFHALSVIPPGETRQVPIVQLIESQFPLHCHPNDLCNPFNSTHATRAGQLHKVLSSIPRGNRVWEALRSLWAGLTMYSADRRHPFFWIALESLFGSSDAAEITYKLSQRIAFFLADNPHDARQLYAKAKKGYGMRSKIVHGRWEDDPELDLVMADTESILRTAFRRLIESPEMLRTFLSKRREAFLEEWVFSRATDPPPFPNL
jgi:hypothetical protein